MDEVPEVAELDLNPVIVTPAGAVAVDVRVRLAPASPRQSPFRRRLR
ncbi:MAG: Acyl-CoA synthetase forming-like protein [Sphaerisporangium sp.]|nr:Acyl-CoA synthetase forming-like protein [Sphaerisporangium sp.]